MESAEILTRLRLLEDERSIVRTLYRYAHAQYNAARRQSLDCVTDCPIINQSRHVKIITALEDIKEYNDAISHAPHDNHQNLVYAPVIEKVSDIATVASHFLHMHRPAQA